MGLDQDEFDQLALRRRRKDAIRDAVTAHYGKGLDALEVELDLAAEIAQLALGHREGRRANPTTFAAISRLHAAVILTAGEIVELLRAGFAAGATARWRTLYESAIVSHFISGAGEETATRYLEHIAVQLHKLARSIEEAESGSMRTEDQLDRLEARVAILTDRHGPGFSGDYGWAGLALSGNGTDKGSFAAVESHTPSKEDRVFYRTASQSVHAGPYGPVIGSVPYADGFLLLGPTPYQLAGTGQVTAKWIYFSAAAVVAHSAGPSQLNGMIARCGALAKETHNFLQDAEENVDERLAETLATFVAPPPYEP